MQRRQSKRSGNVHSHVLKRKEREKNVNLGGIERVYSGRQYSGIRFIDVKPGNVAVKPDTFSFSSFPRMISRLGGRRATAAAGSVLPALKEVIVEEIVKGTHYTFYILQIL